MCPFHLVVSGAVVAVEITVQRDAVSLHQSSGGVCEQSLSEDAVHQSDVVQVALSVGVYGEDLVESPRE